MSILNVYKVSTLAIFLLFSTFLYAQTDPYVEIKGSVNGRVVSLAALGSSTLEFSYLWTQDETNPEQLSFSSTTDEAITTVIPEIEGEFFVNVTVRDTEDKFYTARRIITSDDDGVFINTLDHYPQWVNSMNLYEINPYSWNDGGGIFSNVTNYLDNLVDLGINTIWFTPIFESLSQGMGYWTYDYYKIHSNFGSNDDLKALVETAHEKGVRIILDIVFNHTWKQHPFFQSCLSDKDQSPYADYYVWDGVPGESNYEYFYDWDQLPNLNVANPDVEEYLIDVAEYWLTEFDIDGYRADVAWGVELRSDVFWKNLNKRLRNIKPEIYMLGEGPAIAKPGSLEYTPSNDHDKTRLFDDRFNSAYDWELRGWAADKGLPGAIGGSVSLSSLHEILSDVYPERALPLRFMENHDIPRAAAIFDIPRSKLAHSLVFTVPGVPLLYCGGEMGQTEQFWSLGNDPGGVQSYFKRIIQTRRNYIKNESELVRLPNSKDEQVYSYATISDDHIVVSALNFSGSQKQIILDLGSLLDGSEESVLLKDLINDINFLVDPAHLGALPLTLSAYESRVYVFNPRDNLIVNGGFDSGVFPWYTYINEAAGAMGEITNKAFSMKVSDPGVDGWHIQLIQGSLPIEEGETYELSFRASADEERHINVIVGEDGNNFSAYFAETIMLTNDLSTYNFSFTMNESNDLNARFVIEMGGSDADVLMDNFVLRKKGNSDGIKSLDFDSSEIKLLQNYPNPFTNSSTISFGLDKAGPVELIIYNIEGQKITTLVSGRLLRGYHNVSFYAEGLPSGFFIYELKAGGQMIRKKMLKY